MIENYLITALRGLTRNRLYSFINIFGLAVGLAACILIALFVREELSFDKWIPGVDDIYRLEVNIRVPGRLPETFAVTTARAKQPLESQFAEIDTVTRLFYRQIVVQRDGSSFFEQLGYVDANFFEIFDLPAVAGDPKAALEDMNSVILSETLARKYFGDEPAVGKTLVLRRQEPKTYRVGAVIRDLPDNTHLALDIIIRINREEFTDDEGHSFLDNWGQTSVYTYIRFAPDTDIEGFASQLDAFTDRSLPRSLADFFGTKASEVYDHYLVAVTDIHLHGAHSLHITPGGDALAVKSFSAVAVLILMIACMNFINLATARSTLRAREVGIRKVLGARRRQIMFQFLGEAVVISVIALAIALGLVDVAMIWSESAATGLVNLNLVIDPSLLIGLAGLAIVVGLGAGFYPSFVMSAHHPADVLGSGKPCHGGSTKMRAFLVVIQFSISIGLIVATTVVYEQTQYAKNLELGFDKENLMILRGVNRPEVAPSADTLKHLLLEHADISEVAGSNSVPTDTDNNFVPFFRIAMGDAEVAPINTRYVDYDYFETYGIEPVAGRLFARSYGSDEVLSSRQSEASVVLNEAAARRLGFASAADAIGEILEIRDSSPTDLDLRIIGVIPDVHTMPVNYEIEPKIFFLTSTFFPIFSIRYRTSDLSKLVSFVEQAWHQVAPDTPSRIQFLDQQFDANYADEELRAFTLMVFAGLAIVVSCLGLFGLASFTTERRTKEISIRKALGATVRQIVALLVWQFSLPVLLANLIAWPVAWYFMRGWLSGFAYRIDLSISYFLGAGAAALLIAWATVGIHAARVARANPINALRHE